MFLAEMSFGANLLLGLAIIGFGLKGIGKMLKSADNSRIAANIIRFFFRN